MTDRAVWTDEESPFDLAILALDEDFDEDEDDWDEDDDDWEDDDDDEDWEEVFDDDDDEPRRNRPAWD